MFSTLASSSSVKVANLDIELPISTYIVWNIGSYIGKIIIYPDMKHMKGNAYHHNNISLNATRTCRIISLINNTYSKHKSKFAASLLWFLFTSKNYCAAMCIAQGLIKD